MTATYSNHVLMPAKLLVSPGLTAYPETTEATLAGGLTSVDLHL